MLENSSTYVWGQINGVEEDRVAKPHRPLPSGLISMENASLLYYALFVSMWAAAYLEKTVQCTLIYSMAIIFYNEGGLAAIPVVKNVIGAVGLACYCWGTTVILGIDLDHSPAELKILHRADMVLDHGRELSSTKAVALVIIVGIFSTTGHAQDFRDRSGDLLMGRKTIPLLLSQPVARWSLAAMIAGWTVGLIALWQPPVLASVAFTALGLRCLGGYLRSYEEKDDYVSYRWYGFWLLGGNLLPIFPRLRGEMQ
ncbi:hypothetical protein KVR01_011774 [Diaporthe batatas]|uniref:uncharacterized protein n=1 Tax=Diaporthe batatas TaxID=748121 RepID=UPI001D053003|nr:uncharacterized protein KVR01_011774 [Diaporthe batatas]KAG8158652.1 hypothetical protein KVR01_011774 [Diaporthe batatas]